MGPLATQGQLQNITATVANAAANGATIVYGGKQPAAINQGWYFEPTIVDCPHQGFDVVRNELFGPVVSVLTFQDETEVIRAANASRFGLAAGVFTRDIGKALRVTKQIRSGIVWVNTYRMVSPIAPFGGYKDSGWGRESGMDAIYDYTQPKTVWINTSSDPIADPFMMQ